VSGPRRAPTVDPMRLILVRHGDAHAGFFGVIGGEKGCTGLTDLGRRQAGALRDHLAASERLRPDLLLSSTLPRAVETAQIIAAGLGVELADHDGELNEVDPGEADGLTWAEYVERYGRFDMEVERDRPFAPGGDSWNGFHERVSRLLDRFAVEHRDRTVVAACHAGVIMATMRILLALDHPGRGTIMRPSNTGLTEWEHDPERDRWTLHTFNDASHLLGLVDSPEG
jgi:broad specificity phosphatase PhoE